MGKQEWRRAKDVVEFMESEKTLWWKDDSSFVLDIGYMKYLTGALGGKYLIAQAVDRLPNGTVVEKFGTCLARLRELCATTAWHFAPPDAKGVVNSIVDVVANMERGKGPLAVEFPRGTRMAEVGERVATFCSYCTPANDSSAKATTVFGKDALLMRMAAASKAVADKTLKELSPITDCEVYRWLLDSTESSELNMIANEGYDLLISSMAVTTTGEKRVSTAGSAMEHMIAVHETAKAVKASKRHSAVAPKEAPAKKKKGTKY